METFEKVKSLISAQLNKPEDKITMDTKIIEDLGADSLDIVEMLMSLEDEFGITVPDDVATQLSTIGDICKFIDSTK